ncbi:hypothetical protein [Rhodopseudomonas palustris]|uniref:Uncharacterized protein n=1 Tax=Rhodopseudomonas palustris TaxID=1076 RepID=A0A418VJI5_RHOPL|nr:hypothetical protein [Rhodopseudomonas palustris]RJF76305.1 hypothetical protein D4Q52_06735 [Rhodopseudomonas palustris]
MSTGRRTTIGFDRTINLEWLDIAAARILRREPPSEIRKALWDFLEDLVPGNTNSSGRGKTLTVLTRIWLTVPDQIEPLRTSAIKRLASANGDNRVAVHWAMVIATHPFFFDVATHVGKLLALHSQAHRTQIKRRMAESWGDRSTLERAIQHVLKSMAQWGVLHTGSEKGSLVVARNPIHVSDEIAELLVHGIMLSRGRGMPFSQLVRHPALFPFKLQLNTVTLRKHSYLRLQRQGDQTDFVELD